MINRELNFIREMERKMSRQRALDLSRTTFLRRDPETLMPADALFLKPRTIQDTIQANPDASSSMAYGSLNTDSFRSDSESERSTVRRGGQFKSKTSVRSGALTTTDKSVSSRRSRVYSAADSRSVASSGSYRSKQSSRWSQSEGVSSRGGSDRYSEKLDGSGSKSLSQSKSLSHRSKPSSYRSRSSSHRSRSSSHHSKPSSHHSKPSSHRSRSSSHRSRSSSHHSGRLSRGSRPSTASVSSAGRPTLTSSQIYGLGCYRAIQSNRDPDLSLFNKRQTLRKDMYDTKTLAIIT